MTSRISTAYNAVEVITGQRYLEPLCDVEQVDQWRQQFRPDRVRLLLVAESHVRQGKGPGFIYGPNYYTPWWHVLLRPAFGPDISREGLRERGVWVLDMSVIALSGYKKLNPDWSNRPFDSMKHQIFATSWMHHVQQEFEESDCANVVYFDSAASMLPASVKLNATPIKFCGPSNAKRYRTPEYSHGTARFIEAVRAAGL